MENRQTMKKILALALLIIVLLTTFQWFLNHGYIEVTTANPSNSETTYRFVEQKTGKVSEIKDIRPKIKKLVSKGSHEILVRQGENSYFAVIKVGGFLSSNAVSAELVPEKHRKFVGNNPGPCMHFSGQELISFGCKDVYKNAQLHVPASSDRPTYTQQGTTIVEGIIEGIITTNEGSIAVIKAPAGDEDQGAPHTAYILKGGLQLSTGTPLLDLDKNKLYSVRSYKEGFIVHDTTYEQILYYSSAKAKPEKIIITQPRDKKFRIYSLKIQGESIIAAYTTGVVGDTVDIHDTNIVKKSKTEIIIHQNNTSKSYTFNTQYGFVSLCGTNKLCMLTGKRLEVYDINDKKQKHLFTVGGVESVENIKNSLVITRENELLGLDVDTQKGSIQYRLSGYESCGLQKTGNSYTLCLANTKNKKVALQINPDQSNTDSIDKKISELLKLPEVTDVSIYDKFIFISPNLGPLIYDKPTKTYNYDPQTRKTVNEKINQEINKLGIDTNTYKIINTFK